MEKPTNKKPHERFENYTDTCCWQYHIRKENLKEDVRKVDLNLNEVTSLKIKDFNFRYVSSKDIDKCREIKSFIHNHEWLGKMPNRPTHRFIAEYKGIMAGVIVMATPNAFSNILGKDFSSKEKLISRGACISWSPKNLASKLIMYSIKWMIQNTEFRVFSAYSDPEAKELGTVYQACNFIYLGNKFGGKRTFFDPDNPQRGWFSDRVFRKVGQYRKYAKSLGFIWDSSWSTGCKMHWNQVPDEVEIALRNEAKAYQSRCEVRDNLPKHKYIYIGAQDKREKRCLEKLFLEKNPKHTHCQSNGVLIGLPYPKKRGQ